MRDVSDEMDLLTVYHDESASATAATVQVTSTTITLVITGGANAGTDAIKFSDYLTVTLMVAAINALNEGWVATALQAGSEATTGLTEVAATSAFGATNTQYLRGSSDYIQEQAINAASNQIERVCNRSFASASYRQLYDGTGMPRLVLRQRPVTAVSRVSVGVDNALKVRNTSTDARTATVSNDLTNVTLTIIGGANAGSDDVAISTNTIAALATAIEAIGKNWDAEAVNATAGAWPATELLKHEAYLCMTNFATLLVPGEPAEINYDLHKEAGYLVRSGGTNRGLHSGYIWHTGYGAWIPNMNSPRMPPNPGGFYGGHWSNGVSVIVSYTGGYSSTPPDIEQICNELASNVIRRGTRDTSLGSVSSPDFSWSAVASAAMTEEMRKALSPYKINLAPSTVDV